MLAALIAHAAERAGVTGRSTVTPGTLVCPRVAEDGARFFVAVNLDGKGGRVVLPHGGTDACTGAALPAGELELAAYGWRAVRESAR